MLLAEVTFIFSVNHANGPRKMICLADEAIIYVFMVLSSYSSKDKVISNHSFSPTPSNVLFIIFYYLTLKDSSPITPSLQPFPTYLFPLYTITH